MRRVTALILSFAILLLAGCDFPRDPEDTFRKIEGSTLKIGVIDDPPWTELEKSLVIEFAERHSAKVEWLPQSEAKLMKALSKREIDGIVGGLLEDSPYAEKVGFTYSYYEEVKSGEKEKHVIAFKPGENKFISEFEKYLRTKESQISHLIAKAEGAAHGSR